MFIVEVPVPITIRSKRAVLASQAIAELTVVAIAGWLLQMWSPLQTSRLGQLSERSGFPLIAIALWATGIAVVATILWDHWRARIDCFEDHLVISDRIASSRISYDNILEVKSVGYGVGIVLRDPSKWVASFEGTPAAFDKLCRISGLFKATYGCDMCIKKVRLDIGVEGFFAMLQQRGVAVVPPRAVAALDVPTI